MQKILHKIPAYGVVALLAYMPFHIFLSQWLSLYTGGLEVWKVAKDVLLAVLTLFTVCLVYWQGRGGRGVPQWFAWLIGFTAAYGLLHLVVWLAHPGIFAESAIIGTIYNVRIPCFAVLGAGATILYPNMFVFSSFGKCLILKIVLAVGTIVALLGILQYLLPKDILTHFGYELSRGVRPSFFIDDNPAFPRIMSTLRDPNSLGAYLIVPLAISAHLLTVAKSVLDVRKMFIVLAFGINLAALYLTFSRSAWVAALLALALVFWWNYSSYLVRILRRWWPAAVVLVVLLACALFWQRHNPIIDGVLTHSTAMQQGEYDSNELHWMYARDGALDIIERPFGSGPGTAGLASIRDPEGGRLTENYYIQVGLEVGIVGLAMFVGLCVWVYLRIWRRHDGWTVILLASFWAYALTSALLHTWSNEAIAAQWWLLAGAALVGLRSRTAADTNVA